MTRIAVIDHGAGNLVSIARGLARCGADVTIATSPVGLREAAGVVLPGVGATGAAMDRLHTARLAESLQGWSRPLLGICVGLQLLFDRSEEHGGADCLGVVAGEVRRLRDAPLLPHIGWNDVRTGDHPLFAGIPSGTPFYFCHSFAPMPDDPGVVVATTQYGGVFASAVAAGVVVGVQFHPERSGDAGLRLLGNFVTWSGELSSAA